MKTNKYTGNRRRYNRELKRVQLKLDGYINAFIAICYFQEDKLDWNVITEEEFKKLRIKWKNYCRLKGHGDEIKAAFQWECLLLKVDLIMQVKHGRKISDNESKQALALLKKGVKPLDIANTLNKN